MKIAVIGGGNMGGAIAAGAIRAGVVKGRDVTISHLEPKCEPLFVGFRDEVVIEDDNAKAILGADIIIVAVKPWLMEEVLGEISSSIVREKQFLVSIAAGVTFENLSQMLNINTLGSMGLYRIIPNTAIAISQSVNFICRCNTTSEQDEMLLKIFDAVGRSFMVDESQMTPLTSLSSCGIAFAYKYIDASISGGVDLGIEEQLAKEIVLQTVKGAVMMIETNGTMPQTEIDKVTTKGGITIKGLDAMVESGFVESVHSGLKSSR
ncbi:MAG: pyrroline-5-carboxylate reductase dimerization domain-containing protein [Rikenellaceae bacterium]